MQRVVIDISLSNSQLLDENEDFEDDFEAF